MLNLSEIYDDAYNERMNESIGSSVAAAFKPGAIGTSAARGVGAKFAAKAGGMLGSAWQGGKAVVIQVLIGEAINQVIQFIISAVDHHQRVGANPGGEKEVTSTELNRAIQEYLKRLPPEEAKELRGEVDKVKVGVKAGLRSHGRRVVESLQSLSEANHPPEAWDPEEEAKKILKDAQDKAKKAKDLADKAAKEKAEADEVRKRLSATGPAHPHEDPNLHKTRPQIKEVDGIGAKNIPNPKPLAKLKKEIVKTAEEAKPKGLFGSIGSGISNFVHEHPKTAIVGSLAIGALVYAVAQKFMAVYKLHNQEMSDDDLYHEIDSNLDHYIKGQPGEQAIQARADLDHGFRKHLVGEIFQATRDKVARPGHGKSLVGWAKDELIGVGKNIAVGAKYALNAGAKNIASNAVSYAVAAILSSISGMTIEKSFAVVKSGTSIFGGGAGVLAGGSPFQFLPGQTLVSNRYLTGRSRAKTGDMTTAQSKAQIRSGINNEIINSHIKEYYNSHIGDPRVAADYQLYLKDDKRQKEMWKQTRDRLKALGALK
jgi:hypothetical protein